MAHQKLSELDEWQLQEDDQDARGQLLIGASGQQLGTIQDMLVDIDRERISSVVLEDGRAFPVEGLELRDDYVVTHDSAAPDQPGLKLYHGRLVRTTSRQPG